MNNTLVKYGDKLAVVIDDSILEQLGITEETPLEVKSDGQKLVISPAGPENLDELVDAASDEIIEQYAYDFQALAK